MIDLELILDIGPMIFFLCFLVLAPYGIWRCYRKQEYLCAFIIFLTIWCFLWRLLLPTLLFSIFGENETLEVAINFISEFSSSIAVILMPLVTVAGIYFLLGKKFTYSIVSLSLIPMLYMAFLESHFILFPLIDTTYSKEFTLRKFKSITPGMTRDEVETRIGKSYPSVGGYFSGMDGCEAQTGDNGPIAKSLGLDFAWLDSAVCYDEQDIVMETKMRFIRD